MRSVDNEVKGIDTSDRLYEIKKIYQISLPPEQGSKQGR
jgi:hypothetical protein